LVQRTADALSPLDCVGVAHIVNHVARLRRIIVAGQEKAYRAMRENIGYIQIHVLPTVQSTIFVSNITKSRYVPWLMCVTLDTV
jgi:hypothetical protein